MGSPFRLPITGVAVLTVGKVGPVARSRIGIGTYSIA